jgi:CRISPR-associated protein Cas1
LPVLVVGPNARICIRGGALQIDHEPEGEKATVRIDVDTDPKPHAILFDGYGEFLTGEALRWCMRYGVTLILPDGPGRIATFVHSALEATDSAAMLPDTDPAIIRAQCSANRLAIAREIVRAKIGTEIAHIVRRDPFNASAAKEWLLKLEAANTVPQLITIEAQAAMCYWRAFKDMGLREAKDGNLPRSWLRFANRNKGAQFLGNKHAAHPVNAILNYAYVVEAGRLARSLSALGLALPIGFLHSDKKGRNSLVWDAIEPLRPMIDASVFAYLANHTFSRSDFPQTSASTFRLSRLVIATLLSECALPATTIGNAAEATLQLIERHGTNGKRLYNPDMRRKRAIVHA